ncbi:MAG: GNAT family N-acetyltransferase [Thalassobaculum sp.]|uniref:GNAT family N-acetyltransferase n=1 Tax=Thalassobaculum sp. TaxID=2022740 RepID=UPI0032EE8957
MAARRRQGRQRHRHDGLPESPDRAGDGGIGSGGIGSGGLELAWDGGTERDWGRLLAAAGPAPLEQSWGYGAAIAAGSPYRPARGVFRQAGRPVAVVQALVWSIAGAVRLVKVLRGPLFLDPAPDPALRQAAFRLIRDRWPLARGNALFWTPELPHGADADALMRGLGMRRTVTGYTTAWLDLAPGPPALRAGLDQKWRNQLVRAEKQRLRIREAHGGPALGWLAGRHDAHRRRRRFGGPTGTFAAALALHAARPQDVLVLQAERGSDPVAGVLFLRHGDAATYHLAWTGPEGRAAHAHNRLVWEGILRLAAAGVRWLDLGGLDASMPGVSRFKLGLGTEPVTLTGTWF